MKLIPLRGPDHRVMPWKNGGGSTSELAVEPPGASLGDAYAWRLSLATVATSGPFSPFPGYDRVLVQTTGAPVRLAHGRHGGHLLTPLVPYAFPGEWDTAATLGEGEATDFNVMTRRGVASAQVESLVLAPGCPVRRGNAAAVAVYALSGDVSVRGGPTLVTLAPGEMALARDADCQELEMAGDRAGILVVTIVMVGRPAGRPGFGG